MQRIRFILPMGVDFDRDDRLLHWSGRMRGAARTYFPASIILFAPLWILERSISTYWALYWYLRRGGYPFGDRLLSKGIGRDWVEGGQITARMARKSEAEKQLSS